MKSPCTHCSAVLKIIIISLIVFIVLLIYGLRGSVLNSNPPPTVQKFRESSELGWASQTVTINNRTFQVDIANTDQLRTKGLSARERLEQNRGMLFLFPTKAYHSFWMKDMRFPIDIVWIADDRVIRVLENVPLPQGRILETYTPTQPVDKVLEIAAGEASRAGITINSIVTF